MRSGSQIRVSDTEALRWFAFTARSARCIPGNVRRWLGDCDSLTRQIKRTCDGEFRVLVLRQRWMRVSRDETCVLGVSGSQKVLVREVQLLCGGVPRVYARSLIPRAAMTGHYAVLGQMGARPLGEKLFADPIMKRGPVSFSWFGRGTRDYHTALTGLRGRPPRIYGRRSLFSGSRAPIMVMEFFLPGIGPFPG